MRTLFHFSCSSLLLLLAACSNGSGTTTAAPKDPVKTMAADTAGKSQTYTVAMVDNKKDPSCGMPVTAGIGDTVHYQGKVIGFCSKECKDEFLKDPVAGLKKTEFKK
jgi:YHS domain-containing protein